MVEGTAKCLIGVQDDDKDTYRRNIVSTSTWKRCGYPAEAGLTSYRVGNHDEGRNDEALCLHLDLGIISEQQLSKG